MKLLTENRGSAETLYGFHVNLDDLELISAILSQGDMTLRISDSQHEYATLQEVKEKRGVRPEYLMFEGVGSDGVTSVSLAVRGCKARLRLHGSPTSENVALKVRDLIREHDSTVLALSTPLLWLSLAGILEFLHLSGWSFGPRTQGDLTFHTLAILLAVASLGFGARRSFGGVDLRPAHEGSMLKRNADKISLMAIGAVFGVLTTVIARWVGLIPC